MLTMAVGHSDDVDPADAIAGTIDQCRAQLGDRTPQAGLLFAAFEAFDPAMVAAVSAAFPGTALMGSSSSAEMSSAGGYREDSVTLALFASDNVDFSTGMGRGVDDDLDAACRAAVDQALAKSDKTPRVCVMVADALSGQHALEQVRRALPEGVLLVGGASSGLSLGNPRPSFQFCGDSIVQDGVAVLVLSGPLAFSYAVGTGLRPIGPVGTVTRSDYGQIQEIDGRPAAAFVAKYVDVVGPATFGNPLAIREEGSADSYVRVMLSQDPDTHALRIAGSIPVGSTVQLTTATTDEIVAAASDAVRRATEAFPAGQTPSAALVFSCAVRKFLLGTRTGQEVSGARSLLPPDLPLAGMYCTGEISPVGVSEASHFLNESFVTLLLGS